MLFEMRCRKTELPASVWLSLMQDRKTVRVEDEAYALIRLLSLDFPIIYGGGIRSWVDLLSRCQYNTAIYFV